jgi:ATP-dependent Clp protease ATP-binding subunit ClpC
MFARCGENSFFWCCVAWTSGWFGLSATAEELEGESPLDDLDQHLKDQGQLERYTAKAARVMFLAGYQARKFGSPCILPEHILLAIFREDVRLIRRFIHPHRSMEIWKQIKENTTTREEISPSVVQPISPEGERVLALAAAEIMLLGVKQIGTEHLLLGILGEDKSLAAQTLKESGMQLSFAREQVARLARTSE